MVEKSGVEKSRVEKGWDVLQPYTFRAKERNNNVSNRHDHHFNSSSGDGFLCDIIHVYQLLSRLYTRARI